MSFTARTLDLVTGLLVCAACSATVGAQGARPAALKPDSSLVVSTDWLASHASDPGVVLLHVDRSDSAYRAAHIPGARFLAYAAIIAEVNGIAAELPAADSLRALFESAGVSDVSQVVLTGPPLLVTRAFFTLEFLGLTRVAALDGGLPKWTAEGRATAVAAPPPRRGRIASRPRPDIVAPAQWVLERVGKPGFALLDTRTETEYLGTETRGARASVGHIDGARRLEWQDMFRDPNEFSPKGRDELERLWRERAAPGDTVVAYCTVGYRGSGSYFMSRLLGYPVKLYDGSYDEWSKKSLPLVKTVTPLRAP